MKKLFKTLLSIMPFAMMADKPFVVEKESLPPIPPEIIKNQWTNNSIRRTHNNRKNTRGRFTQYIPIGDGRQKAIYHSAR